MATDVLGSTPRHSPWVAPGFEEVRAEFDRNTNVVATEEPRRLTDALCERGDDVVGRRAGIDDHLEAAGRAAQERRRSHGLELVTYVSVFESQRRVR